MKNLILKNIIILAVFLSTGLFAQRDGSGTFTVDTKDETLTDIGKTTDLLSTPGELCTSVTGGCLSLNVLGSINNTYYSISITPNGVLGTGGKIEYTNASGIINTYFTANAVTTVQALSGTVVNVCSVDFIGEVQVCASGVNDCKQVSEGSLCETLYFGELPCDPIFTPLPVECESFKGTASRTGINLEWTTSSEVNNSKFEIQRSLNGVDYITVGTVQGFGNSTTLRKYKFFDNTGLLGGTNYTYRLIQYDFNGASNYACNIVSVKFDSKTGTFISGIIPNPNAGTFDINLMTDVKVENANVAILDPIGKVIFSQKLNFELGLNNVKVDITNHPSTVYYVVVTTSNSTLVEKVIKNN